MSKKRLVLGAVAALTATVALPTNAFATGGESTTGIGYGTLKVKAYHCSFYLKNCDWRSEAIVSQNSSGKYMDWIENEATVTVHGVSVSSLNISKDAGATLVFNSGNTAKVRWRRFVSNNSVTSGNVYAGPTSTYVEVKSCGSGDGPGSFGYVTPKCATAGIV